MSCVVDSLAVGNGVEDLVGGLGLVHTSGMVQHLHARLLVTHSTSAASGGFRYSPTTSRTLSMNWVGRQLGRLGQVRFEPKARQIRLIKVWLMPN